MPLPIVYEEIKLNAGYRIDMLLEDAVIVEVKSVDALAPLHQAQLLTYLRLSGYRPAQHSDPRNTKARRRAIGVHGDVSDRSRVQHADRKLSCEGSCLMNVTKGLVVGEPWIDFILRGDKIWEMKSRPTRFRGWVGLIRKGSGRVSAVARIIGCEPAQSDEQMIATFEKHRIPSERVRDPAIRKWRTPWVLADLHVLRTPVPYVHDSGGAWVNLHPEVTEAIARQVPDGAR